MAGLVVVCFVLCLVGAVVAFHFFVDREPRLGLIFAAAAILVPGGVFLGGVLIGSGWTVSDGERVGVVQKVSERGMFIKTTEVEVALLGGGSGKQVARVWEASLDSGATAAGLRESLEAALRSGASVRIKYREVLAHAPWRMETDYAILAIEPQEPFVPRPADAKEGR